MAMIVVFDAQCLLCNRWVQFLLAHDHAGRFQFASIQGQKGAHLLIEAGLKAEGLETLLLVEGQHTWKHTSAILRILGALGWPWRFAWIFWIIPAQLRDWLYRQIARNRYALFGRSDVCLAPDAKYAARFLE